MILPEHVHLAIEAVDMRWGVDRLVTDTLLNHCLFWWVHYTFQRRGLMMV